MDKGPVQCTRLSSVGPSQHEPAHLPKKGKKKPTAGKDSRGGGGDK